VSVRRRNLVLICGGVFVLACLPPMWSGNQSMSGPAVGGFVFFDDQPLGNADVFFVPEELGGPAKSYIGKSNGGGFYEVPRGVPAGDYRVVIRAAIGNVDDISAGLADEAEIDSTQQLMMAEAKSNRVSRSSHRRRQTNVAQATLATLPDIYSSAAGTILRIRVPAEGTDTADLYLWSDLCEVIASELPANRAIR